VVEYTDFIRHGNEWFDDEPMGRNPSRFVSADWALKVRIDKKRARGQ